MARLRFLFKLVVAFLSRFKALLLLAIIGGVLFYLTLIVLLPNFFYTQREYIGVSGRFRTDDLPGYIIGDVSLGLTTLDEEGSAAPGLAESWQTTDEGKTWEFKLKEGIKWQDGSEVTSDTIQYKFEDVVLETPDRKTIVFKLQNVFAPFPTVVSSPVFKKGLIGTGDWTVKKLQITGGNIERLEMVDRNNHKKIYDFYPSEEAAKTAFKLGQIDKLQDIIDPEPFTDWETVSVEQEVNQNRYVAVFLNNSNEALEGTDKKSLRQGLSYAINKEDFGSLRAISPISPNSWSFNPQVKKYDYDVERAKELIGESDFNITLTTTPALLSKADKVAEDWKQVGVNTTVQVASSIPEDFQAFMAIYNIPEDPDQYSTWHSTQIGGNNFSNYQNPRIDKLLEDGRLELDQDERKKIYLDFQRFLLEDAPAIFLYHPVSYTITRK